MGYAALTVTCGMVRGKYNAFEDLLSQGFLKESLFIIQSALPVLGYARNVESYMGKSVRL